MVPGTYHAFFSGCASVAGTLIGLLFVAISMSPHRDSAREAPISFQMQAAVAFTTLISALVAALAALVPGDHLGTVIVILSGVGISSTVGLIVLGLRDRSWRRRPRELLTIPVLGLLSALELVNGIDLLARPKDASAVGFLAFLMVGFVVIAIAQAWTMIGAPDARLLAVLNDIVHERRREAGDHDAPANEASALDPSEVS